MVIYNINKVELNYLVHIFSINIIIDTRIERFQCKLVQTKSTADEFVVNRIIKVRTANYK